MNALERHDATTALCRWFENQEIEPADAALICADLIATMIAMKPEGERGAGMILFTAHLGQQIANFGKSIERDQS